MRISALILMTYLMKLWPLVFQIQKMNNIYNPPPNNPVNNLKISLQIYNNLSQQNLFQLHKKQLWNPQTDQ